MVDCFLIGQCDSLSLFYLFTTIASSCRFHSLFQFFCTRNFIYYRYRRIYCMFERNKNAECTWIFIPWFNNVLVVPMLFLGLLFNIIALYFIFCYIISTFFSSCFFFTKLFIEWAQFLHACTLNISVWDASP